MLRHLEFVGGSSAKFYEVEVTGLRVVVRYGRLGTSGQSQVKAFSAESAARNHAERLIAQKTAKGYRECAVA